MAYFNKIGLLVLSKDGSKFLVCEKAKGDFTTDFIIPGGSVEEGENDLQCLTREITEELNTEVNKNSLEFLGKYIDVAAGDNTKDVSIRLYKGDLLNEPRPFGEIKEIHWIGKNDVDNPRVSPIIRNKILPDLIKKNILR